MSIDGTHSADANVVWAPDASKLEPIHSGPRHRLYRGNTGTAPVIVKMPAAELPTARAVAAIRHEYELLRQVHVPGVVEALELTHVAGGLALLMADAGNTNLAELTRSSPLSITDFLEIAVQLAETLAQLHRASIVHRDINPSNVLWDAGTRRATLSDFGMASTLSALTIESADPNELVGTLAYVSPEQTGRTGRSIDCRSDLYSLGATFYELVTGKLPFAVQDAIELVHAHIARRPRAAHELSPAVPLALSLIISKLLEKEPEQRYQTADALAMDLREAQTQWLGAASIALFSLASHDVPRDLHIPDKLYGREPELRTLDTAYARACRGGRELVLITGAPGIGKSALVNQLGRAVTEHQGLYVAGKFDQLQRSVPFSGLVQAFRAAVRKLLTQPQATLEKWRERIEDVVAPNGQLLVQIVPELEHILGPQPALVEVGPVEAQNRFHAVFTRFICVFAQREHPLVLFLDDLQWVDAASLQLIERWLSDSSCRHLLVVGAYRDNEVGRSHPLTMSVAAWRNTIRDLDELHLGPLDLNDISQLTAEAVQAHVDRTRDLAELIMRKTAGNAFFVRRLLQFLHAQKLIRFLPEPRAWTWDVTELERAPLADNVLELMTQAIERLPASTQKLLEIGACIGHRFDLDTLAGVSGLSRADATPQIWPALADRLLVPLREALPSPHGLDPGEGGSDALPAMVRFAHDRVQQAAYARLSEKGRRAIHLAIGRRLLAAASSTQLDEVLFDIVDQLDLGEALIVDPAERLGLVELNLAAGRKAKASAAYQAARDYLTVAMRHLPASGWVEHPELTFSLHRELAESAYLTGQHARAEELLEAALAHAPSEVAKADLYSLRVLAATVMGDWARALRAGRDGLGVFSLEWPLERRAEAIEAEAEAVMANVGARRIEDLLDEPEVQDDATRAAMRLLSILGPPAYFSGADVLTFLVTRATNLSLVRGPSPYTAYAYVFYGGIHNARTGEYDVGHAFGKLALSLARRFGNRAEESRTLEVFGLIVQPWKEPVRDSLPLFREGLRAGVESGELAYAAFNLSALLINGAPAGVQLTKLLSDADAAVEFATQHRNRTGVEISLPYRQLARALTGATPDPLSFDDDDFEEARFLTQAEGNQTAIGHFWVARLQAAYLLGDYERARHCSQQADRHIAGILGMITSAQHAFFFALTLAAELANASGNARAAWQDELRRHHLRLVEWARHCPQNFGHQAALVGAELARLSGAPAEAMRLYRAAIDGAVQHLCIQDEALAHELRARFLLSEREPGLAAVHFRAARDRYQQWGATAKVRSLEAERPECFAPEGETLPRRISLDALALIKASQAISAETIPARVFERILRVLAEVAGAQTGALVLCEADELTVHARITTASTVSVSLPTTPLDECPDLPQSILRYVVRMKEPLVIADAAGLETFAADPTLRQRRVRSVLCVPLSQQAQVVGLLYLENDALAGAFTAELVETVQVLAAQAAISIESARLHQAARQEIAQRKQAEQALNQADRRKDEFLAMLAHELRNPLAPISSASEVLELTLKGNTRAQSATAVIKRQVKQLTRLVDELLDVARATQGRIQLTRQPVDWSAVVAHAIETVEPAFRAKEQSVSVTGSDTPLYVDGDFSRLVQCIGNILTNAAKYTARGGQIHVRTTAEGENAVVEVTDNGAGISPQLLPLVFDLFVQSHRTIDRSQGGLGVGLAIVKRLVLMHGGNVTARSEGEGHGSTFTIRLPRISRPPSTPAITLPSETAGRRVLVVDDNVDAAELLVTLLTLQGQEAKVAFSGKEALVTLESFTPDFVLLDLGLPEMDGYEVARRIRDIPACQRIRVVALTGYGQLEDRQRTKAAGFDDHLVKPIDAAALAKVLATH